MLLWHISKALLANLACLLYYVNAIVTLNILLNLFKVKIYMVKKKRKKVKYSHLTAESDCNDIIRSSFVS